MIVLKSKNYLKALSKLNKKVITLIHKQEKLLEKDMFSSGLHTKKLKGLEGEYIYSFRITRESRGLFFLQDDKIILFNIGHRKDIYRSY